MAEAYGDDNPLWCDPAYGASTRWGGPIAPPHLVGGDTLIGEDEVTRLEGELRDLMKGDPLGGVHAFYSGSFREWWHPLHPATRVTRRNALVGVHDKVGEFAGRAVHEWFGEVFAAAGGPVLSGQYRLMIRAERDKAVARGSNDATEILPYTDDELAAIDEALAGEQDRRRGAEPRWWEDVEEGDELNPLVKGPMRVTDMVVWHTGVGMGLYGVRALRLAYQQRQRMHGSSPRRSQHPRPCTSACTGPRVGSAGRQPDELLLRAHARDWLSTLHRLDGRRRLAVDARLPVPQVQLVGDTHWMRGRVVRKYWRRRSSGSRPSTCGREPAR